MIEFDQMWFIFQFILPCGRHNLSSVFQRLDSCSIEALIVILEKKPQSSADMTSSSVRYCFPAKCFFHVEEQKIVRFPQNKENVEGDQPVQTQSFTEHPLQPQTCVQEHCHGETRLPSSVFQAISEMSLVLLFKVLNDLFGVGVSGRRRCSKY